MTTSEGEESLGERPHRIRQTGHACCSVPIAERGRTKRTTRDDLVWPIHVTTFDASCLDVENKEGIESLIFPAAWHQSDEDRGKQKCAP
jgi:hypothetical protein